MNTAYANHLDTTPGWLTRLTRRMLAGLSPDFRLGDLRLAEDELVAQLTAGRDAD